MLTETVDRVKQNYSFRSEWCVNIKEFNVWVYTNSLVGGVSPELNGSSIKDVC